MSAETVPAATPAPAAEPDYFGEVRPESSPGPGEPAAPAAKPPEPAETTPKPGAAEPAAAPTETPVPPAAADAPFKRKFKLTVNGVQSEREADEAEIVAALQIKEAEKDIRFREQLAGAQWTVGQLRSQGVDAELWQDPADGHYEARVKPANTTPPKTPPTPETTDDELLEQAAADLGLTKDHPLFKLHQRQMKRIGEQEAERQRIEAKARETTEAERQRREDEQTAQRATEFFTKNAAAYEGERGTRAQLVTRAALFGMENMPAQHFRHFASLFGLQTDGSPARRRDEVFRIAEMFTSDRQVEWGERLKAAIPAQPKPTPAPPAVGLGSAATAQPRSDTLPSDLSDREAVNKWLFPD